MFLHIGNDVLIKYKDTIGIFELQGNLSEVHKQIQANNLFNDRQHIYINKKDIKSCVLTDRNVYFSNISSITLKRRGQTLLSEV